MPFSNRPNGQRHAGRRRCAVLNVRHQLGTANAAYKQEIVQTAACLKWGQTRTSADVCDTTASPTEADMTALPGDVAEVPIAVMRSQRCNAHQRLMQLSEFGVDASTNVTIACDSRC